VSLRVLIIPDKFKGTLTAQAAAEAIARAWKRTRPSDELELLPMSDGGDGFGEIISGTIGAKSQKVRTVDAAHRPIEATWWWEPKTKTAVIESAKVIGLAMLPPGKFHPFELDTFGLGKVLLAAAKKGARRCIIGIGGSATNDGGFGIACALGWKFVDAHGRAVTSLAGLNSLTAIEAPKKRKLFPELIIAVDVQNKLLGAKGCSRIYGPQKGLRPEDFPIAESYLGKLSHHAAQILKRDCSKIPGAGAAGGLGFGLMAFASGKSAPGFGIFSRLAKLKQCLRSVDLVITGEGAIDQQTLMGKGVGELALLCRRMNIPVIGLAGIVLEPEKAKNLFKEARGLTEITTVEHAKAEPAKYLEQLASETAAKLS
jgi:glycerate kinase